jgi:hypothetical protein
VVMDGLLTFVDSGVKRVRVVLYLYLACILSVCSSVLLRWPFHKALSACFDLVVLTVCAGHDAAAPPWATDWQGQRHHAEYPWIAIAMLLDTTYN